jgi:hypothetical protein
VEERLRAELAEVTVERNTAQQHLDQVTHERDLIVAHHNFERMLVHVLNKRNEA